jgi:hypothetical protein
MFTENRKTRRQSLEQPCWLDKGADHPPAECRLSEISKSGGKLICPAPDQVPDEFNLYLTRDGKVGRKCVVVSRDSNEIGFQFKSGIVQKPQWAPAVLEA